MLRYRASVTDDAYFPGGFTGLIYDRLARFEIGETTGKVLALKQQMPDLVILPAHDPTAAARLLGS